MSCSGTAAIFSTKPSCLRMYPIRASASARWSTDKRSNIQAASSVRHRHRSASTRSVWKGRTTGSNASRIAAWPSSVNRKSTQAVSITSWAKPSSPRAAKACAKRTAPIPVRGLTSPNHNKTSPGSASSGISNSPSDRIRDRPGQSGRRVRKAR